MNKDNPINADYALLTPDFMLDAIESTGIYPASGLMALNSYENRVYQFTGDDELRYVVKFYRPARWSKEQINEEHSFSIELAEQEIPVIPPLEINDTTLHEYNGFYFALFECRGGRQFEVDNLNHLEWVGRFMGRIHKVGQSKPFTQRVTLNSENFLIEPQKFLLGYEEIPDYLRLPFDTALNLIVSLTQKKLEEVGQCTQQRLFGDCHPGNILWTDNGPHFVDLDDSVNGPAVQDLWMMLSGDRAAQSLQLEVLLEGYNEFCDFDTKELQLIEPLRAMRMVNYMYWLAKRWSDPAFPHNFPWFNTPQYWEQQVLALKEQIAQLQEPPLALPSFNF